MDLLALPGIQLAWYVLASISTINVVHLLYRRLRRKTRGTPGIGVTCQVDVDFVFMFRSCGEVWRKTTFVQRLADVTIELGTWCDDAGARARRMGRARRAGVVGWVVLMRWRLRSLGTSLNRQAWIAKRKIQ